MSSTDLTNLDEPQLICLAKSGNDGALSELDLRYRGALVGFARRSVENDADADDLAQSTLAKALTGLDQFETGTNFRSWLFRICRNSIIDWLRKTNRYQATLATRRELQQSAQPDADGEPVATAVGPADAEFGIFAFARRVLSAREYEALWLLYVDQLTTEEIARRLDCRPGAVRVMLTRARGRLSGFRRE